MKFCTAINCIDGRTQLPVINYLKERFKVAYVDCITAAGPNLILAEQKETERTLAILKEVQISVEKHGSVAIAIIGHHDCAGNPAPKDAQIAHIKNAAEFLKKQHPKMEIAGLWVDENWEVNEV